MASYDHNTATYVGQDVNWDKIPHTKASKKVKDNPFYGHLSDLNLKDKDIEIIDWQEDKKSPDSSFLNGLLSFGQFCVGSCCVLLIIRMGARAECLNWILFPVELLLSQY